GGEGAGGARWRAGSPLAVCVGGGSRRVRGGPSPPRPEDRPDATLADGAGLVDQFPASTVWPFVFGFGATVLATGLVFGVWVVLGGAIVLVFGIIGMIRQSRDTTPAE